MLLYFWVKSTVECDLGSLMRSRQEETEVQDGQTDTAAGRGLRDNSHCTCAGHAGENSDPSFDQFVRATRPRACCSVYGRLCSATLNMPQISIWALLPSLRLSPPLRHQNMT